MPFGSLELEKNQRVAVLVFIVFLTSILYLSKLALSETCDNFGIQQSAGGQQVLPSRCLINTFNIILQ